MGLELEVVVLRSESDSPSDEMRISLDPRETVLNLKQIIEEMDETLDVDRQRLIWGGRQLADAEVLENVFRRVANEDEPPKVRLTMRRYAALSPGNTPTHTVRPTRRPAPATTPPAPEPAPPETPAVSPRVQMQTFLMNKAYWSASAEYGAIMTQAAQLGYEVPFADSLFRPQTHPLPQFPPHYHHHHQQPPAGQQQQQQNAPDPVPGGAQDPQQQFDNPEDAEIARQIAAAEAQQAQPALERHVKLAIKLAFFVLMLSQDASPERMACLCGIALCIFLVQTGAARYALDATGASWALGAIGGVFVGGPQDPGAAAQHRGGVFYEVHLFVVSLLACLMPGVHPPQVVFEEPAPPEPAPAEPAAAEGAEVAGPAAHPEEDSWEEQEGEEDWTEMGSIPPKDDALYAVDSTKAASDCSEPEEWQEEEECSESSSE